MAASSVRRCWPSLRGEGEGQQAPKSGLIVGALRIYWRQPTLTPDTQPPGINARQCMTFQTYPTIAMPEGPNISLRMPLKE